ncbi:MAG: AtpZ/AtpI family protein [Proteobacteria bacterium]|nr:AtpZ/AtpI family protein [Pseudomonadota bacterium]
MTSANEKTKGRKAFEAYSLASVGLEMGVAVFLGWLVGQWLDKKFDTDPWLMLVFLLVGIAAGFKALLRAAKQAKSSIRESD